MDALSEILHSVKLEGAVFYNALWTAPWEFQSPPSRDMAAYLGKEGKHLIVYHLVAGGRGYGMILGSDERLELVPGDIIVFPHGDPHLVGNGEIPRGKEIDLSLDDVFNQGLTKITHGGGGEATILVCGFMECDRELCKTFLGGLPPMFKVNIRKDQSGQWLENSIKYSADEVGTKQAGSSAVLARLSEALFAETIRRYMAELPPQQHGWLAGARDPAVGEALALMHRSPEYPWTIANLAQKVGQSRSVLAERFRQYLGEPPMTYLAKWRLRLGARMLRSTSYSVARISGDVGYESEQAFNRAFKREFGVPPARYRAAMRTNQREKSKDAPLAATL